MQRFNSALGLNVHFHLIGLDGVYAANLDGAPEFHELPPPEDAEVWEVAFSKLKSSSVGGELLYTSQT